MSNINCTSNIDRDELLKVLIELSKKEAPELDGYFHWLNATVEINNILGLQPTEEDLKYMEILKKASETEKTLLYDNIKIEGEPVDGKEDDNNLLAGANENDLTKFLNKNKILY